MSVVLSIDVLAVPYLQLPDLYCTLLQVQLPSKYDHQYKQNEWAVFQSTVYIIMKASSVKILLTGSFDGVFGSDPNCVKTLNMVTSP